MWTVFLAFGFKNIPAFGPLLDPRAGIWVARTALEDNKIVTGLGAPVDVFVDKAGVPHFFAADEFDLYRAQGFVMASQRLFQMDISSRVTAGELSALVGQAALMMDQFFLNFGMRESAQLELKKYAEDSITLRSLQAFVDGVNAYVDQMSGLPPEYLVLNARPKRFEPIHVIHMAKLLTFNLSGRSFDLAITQVQQKLGTAKTLELFPEFLPARFEDFILSHTSTEPKRKREIPDRFTFVSQLKNIPQLPLANPGNGSNNWAVAGKKSSTGFSIMANDTHLGLSLPNVWYENQLSCPEFNVYGVSLNTIPGIVLGFNRDVAWGTTNGTTDVLDFYEIEFEDENSLRYKYGDSWLDAEYFKHVIFVKGEAPRTHYVLLTRWGYVVYREGRMGLVADWLGHKAKGLELTSVRRLFSARDYRECLQSLASWKAPLQNFICVDKHNISLQHTGLIPKREIGIGRFIMDGSKVGDPLGQSLPEGAVPALINPTEGFVLSANQKVIGPALPYYLGWDYEEPFRAREIRQFLNSKNKLSPEDMIFLQNSALDGQARVLLPLMLAYGPRAQDLSDPQRELLERLKKWNFLMNSQDYEPTFFKAWLQQLNQQIFADEYDLGTQKFYPKSMRLAWLIERASKDPNGIDADWVDIKNTPKRENLSDLLTSSYLKAWQDLTDQFHNDNYKHWRWGYKTNPILRHVGRIPGFARQVLQMDGSSEGVRGLNNFHGPVYKIVVAFKKNLPEGWIQLPGHNDGNPISPDYDRHVDDWAKGRMRRVEFYQTLDEARARSVRTYRLLPAQEL